MLTNYLLIFLIIMLMSAILTHPAVSVSGAASGLMVWFDSVVPSLFPFMVLTGLLIRTGALNLLSRKMKQIPLVRKLPIPSMFAAVTGLLCGYPMGVRTVSELKTTGQLGPRKANTLYRFVNQPGPMFILGYALPFCGLSAEQSGNFLAAFYGGVGITAGLAVIASAIGSLFRPGSKHKWRKAPSPTFTMQPDRSSSQNSCQDSGQTNSQTGFFPVFENVLMSSMATLVKIGGYMMLFSLIAALIKEFIPNEPTLCLFLSGLLEMTSGLALTPLIDQGLAPYIVLGFIAFGGLSVAAQSFSLGNLSAKEQLNYLLWKLIQTICTISIYHFIRFM